MYIKLNGNEIAQYPYSHTDLRNDNPNTSFPANPSDEDLARFNAARVIPTDRPEPTVFTQVVEADPELVKGVWHQRWKVLTMDEVAAAALVRNNRSKALSLCDWTQIPDSPLTQEQRTAWATYREELRAVPDQVGFPYNVVWPTPPQAGGSA